MAKKATGKKMATTTTGPKRPRTGVAVRLEVPAKDHERLARLARERGLSLASYARQALYERMRDDESAAK